MVTSKPSVPTGARRPGERPARPAAPPRKVSTEALLLGRSEVIIEHRGDEYRLRVTSNGKLLLTK